MKCRDMNPGNPPDRHHDPDIFQPSMKCRDMNPGNFVVTDFEVRVWPPLNEVPGYESRQSDWRRVAGLNGIVPQ